MERGTGLGSERFTDRGVTMPCCARHALMTYQVEQHGHVTDEHLSLLIAQQRVADDIARLVGNQYAVAATGERQACRSAGQVPAQHRRQNRKYTATHNKSLFENKVKIDFAK